LEEKKEITMAEFRDLAKTSRKFAVPLMEYFDSQKLTQRVGDKRMLRG
jgi:selenocysteine-specific elongation factor